MSPPSCLPRGVGWLHAGTAAVRGVPGDPPGLSSPCCSSLCLCQILPCMQDSSASCRNTLSCLSSMGPVETWSTFFLPAQPATLPHLSITPRAKAPIPK